MKNEETTDYSQLEAGYEFPPGSYKLDAETVSTFLKAVEDTSPLYKDSGLVPPMAVAASAMATLSSTISLPPGSIHVSQELDFVGAVKLDEKLTNQAVISRAQKRGKLHLIAVTLNVCNESQETVLTGKTSFILPQQDGED